MPTDTLMRFEYQTYAVEGLARSHELLMLMAQMFMPIQVASALRVRRRSLRGRSSNRDDDIGLLND